MKTDLNREILLIDILAILLVIIIVLFPSSLLRAILGVPFLLFFPGYTCIAAIVPRRDGLEKMERVALGLVISIVISVIIGLILNYTPWGIRLYPVLICLASFVIITSAIALVRRRGLAAEEGPAFSITFSWSGWIRQGLIEKVLSVALVVAVAGTIGAIAYAVATPMEEKFTEFYVLGPDGKAEGYPENLVAGQAADVIIGVFNHEYGAVNYELEIVMDGTRVADPTRIALKHGERWEQGVSFVPAEAGQQKKVEFWLYKDEAPYRSLYLPVNVREM